MKALFVAPLALIAASTAALAQLPPGAPPRVPPSTVPPPPAPVPPPGVDARDFWRTPTGTSTAWMMSASGRANAALATSKAARKAVAAAAKQRRKEAQEQR